MELIIERALPIVLLFAVGIYFKRTGFVSSDGMDGLKKIVVNISLPSVLFNTFRGMEFETSYFYLIALIMVVLALMMLFGKLMNLIPFLNNKFNPYISTGYAYGLVGISLFSIMYGEENMAIFSVIALAHELFVWLPYMCILNMTLYNQKVTFKEIIKLLTSPIMFGIFSGIFLNATNLNNTLADNSIFKGFIDTVNYFASISTPVILISIGYSINFSTKQLKPTLKLMLVKFLAVIFVGVPFKFLVVDNVLPPSELLDLSFMCFLILPPVVSSPIFIEKAATVEEHEIFSSAVAIYTIVSIVVFVIFSSFYI